MRAAVKYGARERDNALCGLCMWSALSDKVDKKKRKEKEMRGIVRGARAAVAFIDRSQVATNIYNATHK